MKMCSFSHSLHLQARQHSQIHNLHRRWDIAQAHQKGDNGDTPPSQPAVSPSQPLWLLFAAPFRPPSPFSAPPSPAAGAPSPGQHQYAPSPYPLQPVRQHNVFSRSTTSNLPKQQSHKSHDVTHGVSNPMMLLGHVHVCLHVWTHAHNVQSRAAGDVQDLLQRGTFCFSSRARSLSALCFSLSSERLAFSSSVVMSPSAVVGAPTSAAGVPSGPCMQEKALSLSKHNLSAHPCTACRHVGQVIEGKPCL